MAPAFVFGYGSLLDGATGTPCRLAGWRRRFGVAMDNRRTIPGYKYFLDARTGARPELFVAFLDVVPEPGASVQGIAAEFDAARLAALDDRERNYERREVTDLVDADHGARVWAYVGSAAGRLRLARGRRRGTAVVSHGYLEKVRSALGTVAVPPDLPVRALLRRDVGA